MIASEMMRIVLFISGLIMASNNLTNQAIEDGIKRMLWNNGATTDQTPPDKKKKNRGKKNKAKDARNKAVKNKEEDVATGRPKGVSQQLFKPNQQGNMAQNAILQTPPRNNHPSGELDITKLKY